MKPCLTGFCFSSIIVWEDPLELIAADKLQNLVNIQDSTSVRSALGKACLLQDISHSAVETHKELALDSALGHLRSLFLLYACKRFLHRAAHQSDAQECSCDISVIK